MQEDSIEIEQILDDEKQGSEHIMQINTCAEREQREQSPSQTSNCTDSRNFVRLNTSNFAVKHALAQFVDNLKEIDFCGYKLQSTLSYEIPASEIINVDFFGETKNMYDLVEFLSGIEKSKYSLKQLAFEYLASKESQVHKLTVNGKIVYNQLVWMRKQSIQVIAHKASKSQGDESATLRYEIASKAKKVLLRAQHGDDLSKDE